MNNPNMSQFFEIFIDEGRDQIALLERCLMELEEGSATNELLQDVFRAAHTLKGSSKAMGLLALGDLTHRMEDVLDSLRGGTIAPSTHLVTVMLRCTDHLKELLETVAATGTDEVADRAAYDAAMNDLGGLLCSDASGGLPVRAQSVAAVAIGGDIKLRVTISGDCALKGGRAAMAIAEAKRLGDVVGTSPTIEDIEDEKFASSFDIGINSDVDEATVAKRLSALPEIESVVPVDEAQQRIAANSQQQREQQSSSGGTIRVPVNRIDKLLNLVGELVTDRTRVSSLCLDLNEKYKGDEITGSLMDVSARIAQITSELQDEVMKTRMLPIDNVFQRMPRVVRDLAQSLGKSIGLDITGGDTEIDRSLIDAISDPLIHLLRNCVDHGIEMPEEREKAGKPVEGSVQLSARHQENHIVIEITDDGKGISSEAIKRKAVEKGLITQATADTLSEGDAFKLVFASGLSTAKNVSEISGRGVGMDIVKTNLERIGGRVTIDSHVGSGTRFTIFLPLTLAIIQSLLIEAGEVMYAVPLVYVVETLKLGKGIHLEKLSGHWAMVLRGETVPLIHLCSALNGTSDKLDAIDDQALVVVIRIGSSQYGICVDKLMGELEVVIKPLGKILGEVNGISGASVLGDGNVALIVDPAKLSAHAA